MKKKLLCMMLALCMILTMLPGGGIYAAESGTGGEGENTFTWMLDDEGTLTISGSGTIELEYDDVNYNYVCPWENENVNKVIIEEGITEIGERAFYGCFNLTDVTIPESVTRIGNAAFSWCSSLTSLTIPDSVTSIGWNSFQGCSNLESITIPDNVTCIEHGIFFGCSSLKNMVIPNGIESIGGGAFQGCSSLVSVTIPDSVKSIDAGAFENCSSLASVTIPVGVTNMGMKAFDGTVFWGDEKNWENGVFYYGDWLLGCEGEMPEALAVKEGTIGIAEYTFYECQDLKSVTIPDGVTRIGKSAFAHCSNLKSVTIPAGMISIGEYAFGRCSSLESITIPPSVTSIGRAAFLDTGFFNDKKNWENGMFYYGDWMLDYNAEIPEDVTVREGTVSISDGAFYWCHNLKSVTIPSSVTGIGKYAFEDCESLTSVTIPKSITYIGEYALGYGYDSKWNRILADGFSLCCYKGSAGEAYAKKNGISYELIKDSEQEMLDKIISSEKSDVITIIPSKEDKVSAEILEKAKEKDISLEVISDISDKVTWTFDEITNPVAFDPEVEIEAFVPAMETAITEKNLPASTGYTQVIFSHEGDLPGKAKVTLDLSKCKQFLDGQKLYLYYFNPTAGTFKRTSSAKYNDGAVTFTMSHCSDYLVTNERLPGDESVMNISGGITLKNGTMDGSLDGITVSVWKKEAGNAAKAGTGSTADGTVLTEVTDAEIELEGGTYSVSGLEEDDYVLKISKKNFATYSYEFTVSDDEEKEVNVSLHLIGDIDGDGYANMKDLNRICDHIRGKKKLTGYEFACADITEDGKSVDARDLNRLCDHVRNKASLWK